MKSIYSPEEDSFLLQECLKNQLKTGNRDLKILEIGCGSGFQLIELKKLGFNNIKGVDINKNAVDYSVKKGLDCIVSNLFNNIHEKYDIILFNPPYLPFDEKESIDSQIATTGGKKGSEIINKFLKEALYYLNKNGSIFLVTSNLTKDIKWNLWKKEKIAEKKLFFERIYVWKIWR